jgi:hypothetical protein
LKFNQLQVSNLNYCIKSTNKKAYITKNRQQHQVILEVILNGTSTLECTLKPVMAKPRLMAKAAHPATLQYACTKKNTVK